MSEILRFALDSSDEELDDLLRMREDDWSSSEEDDDDERMFEERELKKNEGFFDVVLNGYDDHQFVEHFRVSHSLADEIALGFQTSNQFHQETGGYGKLSPLQQTLIFLWFAGHQTASFRDVADRFHITISCLHRVTRRLIYYLSGLSNEVVRWPSEAEKRRIAESFREMGFLPNVIGAIDGSHIKIDRPAVDEMSYCNRKKYFSIQVTCDHHMKITSLLVGFPGSVHDARVFRRSPLGQHLRERCGDYVILGDSAYPCSRNLLTPFKDTGTLTRRQKKYNKKHSRCRTTVEHCFGVLKQKFRQLFHCKLRTIKDLVHFVRACCVLHNLGIEERLQTDGEQHAHDEQEDTDVPLRELDDEDEDARDAPEGIAYRNYVLTNPVFQ